MNNYDVYYTYICMYNTYDVLWQFETHRSCARCNIEMDAEEEKRGKED